MTDASIEEPLGEVPPITEGFADFAGAWNEDEGIEAEEEGVSDLPVGFAETAGTQMFHSAADIRRYFIQKVGSPFIDWFNANIAKRGAWQGKSIEGHDLQAHFDSFWDSYARPNGVSLTEFIAYMCIFINERNGELVSKSELFGMRGHPGVAYLFDSIVVTTSGGRTFRKASYNAAPNKLAGDLFNDPDFNAAHGQLPLADQLKGSRDPVWRGQAYPQRTTPVSGDPAITGYVLESDFFKFRGRGLIQTTWRSNYLDIVRFVQAYAGQNPVLLSFKQKWKEMAAELVCTVSSNSDWDTIFENTDNETVCEAIRLHAKSGKYLPLAQNSVGLNANRHGSLVFFGQCIGGTVGYGLTVKARASEIAALLARGSNGEALSMNATSTTAAFSFVESVELPEPSTLAALEALEAPAFDFDKAKNQAMVVGSDIVGFVSGVTEDQRQDIVNSALLAQLVANKRVPDKSKVFDWYDSYFDTLTHIGWVIQDKQFSDYVETTQDLQAHEAILAVATSLLGPATAALQVVKAALDALQKMRTDSPWITLFDRESRSASTAQFQVTLAEKGADGQFLVTLMAFGLLARSDLTQVLFFKFQRENVELKHSSGKVTIDSAVLASVRPAIQNKLSGFVSDFVRGLPDL